MKRIHLHGFKIAGVGHTAVGTWRNPYNAEHRYTDLEYWQDTARALHARGRYADCHRALRTIEAIAPQEFRLRPWAPMLVAD